jgi:dephospho-CoA kinase
MIVVGLTGGIGSGKSYVSQVFEALGVPVFQSDRNAKMAYDEVPALREAVIREFGPQLYEGGAFRPEKMAEVVFKDPQRLQKLNALVHPIVAKRFREWLAAQDHPYVIKEAAILFESGAYKQVDMVIAIYADQEERILRTMKRDDVEREDVLRRMSKQWDPEQYLGDCDYIVRNNGNDLLLPQIVEIDEDLKRRADQGN